jgi:truncated hemoglobin YjbI
MGSSPRRRAGDLDPDPEMWAALENGAGLRRILREFYDRVYSDPRLAPFFAHVTKEHVIDKQYSFLADKFSGSRLYFGDRPRNAHHWMVISDELFDHREALMMSCLRSAGLPEHLAERWRRLEEAFRKQIVKSRPIPRKIRGIALPLDGYRSEVLLVGTLCDDCSRELGEGTRARYHVRTGRTYCEPCAPDPALEPS